MHDPDDLTTDAVLLAEQLLQQLLETTADAQAARLDDLCSRNPECAALLRRAYASVANLGLLDVGRGEPRADGAAHAPSDEPAGLPRAFGTFRLLELLGAGGMGAVYRAEDTELGRQVALKLIRSEMLASERARTRFQREAAALARLDHPGLCTIYRAGTTDGQPWIAMRLVRGTSLATALQERRGAASAGSGATSEEISGTLTLFEKVARALAAAHAVGVVHRDVKPANIVLAEQGEPVVIDFGLVHLADSETHLTMSGDHIGTPAFMAPEQVAAGGHEVDARADVYALGVTMFEALALQSPYEARSREELFAHVVRGQRRRLRQVRRGLPADLELVLEKALDRDPARRYATMAEFADDLARVRRHEPPHARPIGRLLRLRRWCQRNPVAATFLTLLSLGLGTALALDRERAAEARLREALAWGNLANLLTKENPDHALDLALEAVALAPDHPEALGALLGALQAAQPHEGWPLPWPKEDGCLVDRLIVAPDGGAALVIAQRPGNQFARPVLWRDDGREPRILDVEEGAFDAHWSQDGQTFLTTRPEHPPRLWRANGELVATVTVPGPRQPRIARARFLPDGDHVVFACGDGVARILRRSTDEWLRLEPPLHAGVGVRGLAVSADGAFVALGDELGMVVLHRTAEALRGQPGTVLRERGPQVQELDLGHSGVVLQITSKQEPQVSLLDRTGTLLASWSGTANRLLAAPLDPATDRVLALGRGGQPQVLRHDGSRLDVEQVLGGLHGLVWEGCFEPDGRRLLLMGVDGSASVWDARAGRPLLELRGVDKEPFAGAFLGARNQCLLVTRDEIHRFALDAAAGPRFDAAQFSDMHVAFAGAKWPGPVIAADTFQLLRAYDARGRVVRSFAEAPKRRSRMQLSQSGDWLCTTSRRPAAGEPAVAQIYGPSLPPEPVQRIELPFYLPEPVFGPGDQLLFVDVGDRDRGGACMWLPDGTGHWRAAEAADQQHVAALCSDCRAVAFHAPSSTLAVARADAPLTLFTWSPTAPHLREPRPLPEVHDARLLAWAPDGRHLLASCTDRVVRLLDRDGKVLERFTGHIGTIHSLDFAPGGDRLLLAAEESGVVIHDLEGRLLLPIRPPAGTIRLARFMPDGEHVLLGNSDGVTRTVPFRPEALVARARAVPRPEMPPAYRAHYRVRAGGG